MTCAADGGSHPPLASLPEAVRAYLGNPERFGVEVRSAFLGLSDAARQSIIRALRDGSLNRLEAEEVHDIAGKLLFRDFVVRLSQIEEP